MSEQCDIAVIGAGAAGLSAAIFAAESARSRGRSAKILVLDGAATLGAKILVSGGGRCNVTNVSVRPEDFNAPRRPVAAVLAAFDARATVRWFNSLGVELKCEPAGKLFPVTDRARTVLDALLRRCATLGVEIRPRERVQQLVALEAQPRSNEPVSGFRVRHTGGELFACQVIMATGGRSLPRSGSDGAGWELLRRLGHTVTETYPALVPLLLQSGMFHVELSGVSQEVVLSTFAGGRLADRRRGSLLWTHFGVSGPVVMDASRHWLIADANHKTGEAPVELRCSFIPETTFETVERGLVDQAASQPRLPVLKALPRILPQRMAGALVRHAGIDSTVTLAELSRGERRRLVHHLTDLLLPVAGPRGWNQAEVTAGGVPLSEVDPRSMRSRRLPGLFLVGELLDCDGRIGGFNFQWAWSTGYVAGSSAGALDPS